ncbi:hypothetical protein MRX96_041944 [Rhipicephalus microplus]
MPSARSNFAAAVLEGCIYVIGGLQRHGDYKDRGEVQHCRAQVVHRASYRQQLQRVGRLRCSGLSQSRELWALMHVEEPQTVTFDLGCDLIILRI